MGEKIKQMKAVLSAIVALVALAIGVLHIALVWVLFRGNFGGPQGGPPPGAPRLPVWPGILPLPQLFLANFVAYLILAILLLAMIRRGVLAGLLVDALLLAMTIATLVGWNNIRRPNPRGLGTWAVSLEIALIVLLLVHAVILQRRNRASAVMLS